MRQIDFSNGRVGRNILQASVPMLVAQILSLLYSIVDRFFIGRIPGESQVALAGIGLCFPIIVIVTAFTNLFGMGGAPLCSIYRGKGETENARRVMNTAFFMLSAASIVLFASGEIFASPLLRLFGASDATIVYALPYLRIYLIGTFFSMIATGLNPYINAQGYAGTGMLTVTLGAVSNLILDPVFIFGFGMGVRGAALATIISQCLSAIYVIWFLRRPGTELKLEVMRPPQFAENKKLAANIAGLGTAPFIMQLTNSLVNIVCNHVLSNMGGDLYVTVMTVVSSVRQILETPVLALTEGASPVLSYNYGANRPKLVRRSIYIMAGVAISYTAVIWSMIEWQPHFFIRIFSNEKDVLSAGVQALHLYFFAFIFQALQYSGQSTFKALNKKKRAIFFSLFRKVILVVPLTILLPRVSSLGIYGVFAAEPVSNVIGGSACFITMLATIFPELKRMEKGPEK